MLFVPFFCSMFPDYGVHTSFAGYFRILDIYDSCVHCKCGRHSTFMVHLPWAEDETTWFLRHTLLGCKLKICLKDKKKLKILKSLVLLNVMKWHLLFELIFHVLFQESLKNEKAFLWYSIIATIITVSIIYLSNSGLHIKRPSSTRFYFSQGWLK